MQRSAAGGERYAYVTTLGPAGYVSETRRVLASSLPSDNFPVPLDLLFDEDLYAQVNRSRRSKRARRVDATIEGLVQVDGASRSIRGEDCPVCLQEFRAGETLRAMPCCHAFHYDCISQWLHCKPICPLCRHQLLPDDDDDEEYQHQSQRRRTI